MASTEVWSSLKVAASVTAGATPRARSRRAGSAAARLRHAALVPATLWLCRPWLPQTQCTTLPCRAAGPAP
eukprot:2605804-Rhodomonas_salina.1